MARSSAQGRSEEEEGKSQLARAFLCVGLSVKTTRSSSCRAQAVLRRAHAPMAEPSLRCSSSGKPPPQAPVTPLAGQPCQRRRLEYYARTLEAAVTLEWKEASACCG